MFCSIFLCFYKTLISIELISELIGLDGSRYGLQQGLLVPIGIGMTCGRAVIPIAIGTSDLRNEDRSR